MQLLDALADLVLGATCPGCEQGSWGFCDRCSDALEVPVQEAPRFAGLPIVAANPYRPILEHAIPRYKDDGALHLENVLAERLSRAVSGLRAPATALLVPVPSRPSAVRARGFDHAARLASSAGRKVGLSSSRILRRRERGADQQGLGKRLRVRNVAGTMFVSRRINEPVVLVDDIVTTGASLHEAASTLQQHGIRVLGAAVIAAADQ